MDREQIAIGRLGAPKGVRGDLKVHSYSGETAHFLKLKEVVLKAGPGLAKPLPSSVGHDSPGRAMSSSAVSSAAVSTAAVSSAGLKLKVLRVTADGDSLTMAFAGYESPETARALTGLDIIVPMAAAAPLRPGEWYVDDLVGLSLIVEGKAVAIVRSFLEGGPEPWLEAQRSSADRDPNSSAQDSSGTANPSSEGVSLVPFRKEFVGEIDLEKGTIELLAPWLLEE